MRRNAIYHSRINHYRQCIAIHNCSTKRLEKLFSQIIFTNNSRSTIFTWKWCTIANIMFQTGCNIVCSNCVVILALITTNNSGSHFCIYICIFAKALPNTWPTSITPYVHGRWEVPRNIACTGFISSNLSTFRHQITVESSSHSYFLWKESATGSIGNTVYGIYSIYNGNTSLFDGTLLYCFDGLFPHLCGTCSVIGCIKDWTYFVFPQYGVKHCVV